MDILPYISCFSFIKLQWWNSQATSHLFSHLNQSLHDPVTSFPLISTALALMLAEQGSGDMHLFNGMSCKLSYICRLTLPSVILLLCVLMFFMILLIDLNASLCCFYSVTLCSFVFICWLWMFLVLSSVSRKMTGMTACLKKDQINNVFREVMSPPLHST